MVPSSSLEIWLFQAQLKLARTGGYQKMITWAKKSSQKSQKLLQVILKNKF